MSYNLEIFCVANKIGIEKCDKFTQSKLDF
jgi:hypothetical protein